MIASRASAAIALVALAGAPARAQVPGSPLDGVLVPNARAAGDADATALELNPGQLGLLRGSALSLIGSHWESGSPRPGRGVAAMLAAPLAFGLSGGAGLHWIAPSVSAGAERRYKLQLGLGMALGRAAGLGVSWQRVMRSPDAGLSAIDVGAGVELHRRLAAGVAIRRLGAEEQPRLIDVELTLRPFGRDTFEVALGARLLRHAGDAYLRPRARLQARVARGTHLFAELDTSRGDLAIPGGAPGDPVADRRAVFGLVAGFGHSSITAAGLANWSRGGPGAPDAGAAPGVSVALSTSAPRRPAVVEARRIQKVKLAGYGSDRAFVGLVAYLRRLGDDDSVGAVLLDTSGLGVGLGRVEELRTLVARLRRSKPVYAHARFPSTREMYLAAACERIFLHPAGSVGLSGLAQTVTFYKGALDKLGVEVELERIAEWKGAMEPAVLTESSEAVRANRRAILDEDFERIVTAVADGRAARGVDAAKVRALIDRGVLAPEDARESGLIDGLADDHEIEGVVQAALGRRWPLVDGAPASRASGIWRAPRVAIVLVEGAIVDSAPAGLPLPQEQAAVADAIVKALEAVRGDPAVRAVVLRVNSPGGSAFASDRIARAVARVRKAGKPVVVSMGDLAASGGYYVAAPADAIFASPSTLTGSIGIYGYKVDASLLAQKLGLSSETETRGARSDLYTAYRPWTPEERALIREQLEHAYRRFLEVVAAGRKARGLTDAARVDAVGRGRVWTGAAGARNGLVDLTGGLADAIDEAARRGGVPTGPGELPALVVLPQQALDPLETLLRLRRFIGTDAEAALRLLLPLVAGPGHGVEARLPYEIDIR